MAATFYIDKRNYLDFMIKWAVFITNITLMHFQKGNKKPSHDCDQESNFPIENKPTFKILAFP